MKYKRSILHGYDKPTEKLIAEALHIPLHVKQAKIKRRHVRKGVRHHENT